MDKQTKIIPLMDTEDESQKGKSILVESLLSTLSDIDQELENHLNQSSQNSLKNE